MLAHVTRCRLHGGDVAYAGALSLEGYRISRERTWLTRILYSLRSPCTRRHSWYSLRTSTMSSVYMLCSRARGNLASCALHRRQCTIGDELALHLPDKLDGVQQGSM